MGEIQLRRLRYFVAVAQELHFGRAARRLDMAQPPLSQQIQRLEAELGMELFRRYPRRIELTSGGRLLLSQAEPLLAQADRVEMTMRCAAQGVAGPLTVGFARSAGYALLPTIMRAFHERYPDVKLNLQEHTTPDQNAALLSGRIDVGIVRQHLADADITLIPLAGERVIAALPDTHPLSTAATLTMDDLAPERFVFLSRRVSPDYYDLLLDSCRAAGFTPQIAHEAPDPPSLTSLVSAGLFVALVPHSAAAAPRPHVVYREVADLTATVDFFLAFRTEGHDHVVTRFCDVARETMARCTADESREDDPMLQLVGPVR
jgi:DNA-binding transcriptional LysR family regulator